MRELLRLLRRAPQHHGALTIGFLAAIATAAFSAVTAKLTILVASELDRVRDYAAAGVLLQKVGLFIAGLIGLALLKGLLTFASRYYIAKSTQAILAELRGDLYANLVERPIGYLAKHHTAEFVSRVTSDVQRIEIGLSMRLSDLAAAIPETIVLVGFLWWQNALLAFLVTVILPLAALLVRRWSRKIKTASRRSAEHTATLANVLNETLGGIRIVKAFVGEKRETQRFGEVNETLRRANMRAQRTLAVSQPALDVVGALLFAVLIGIAAFEIARGVLTTPELLGFFVALVALHRAGKKVTTSFTEMQNTSAAARRCFDILDDDHVEPGGRREIAGLQSAIDFHQVVFSYGGDDVLCDFTLSVRKGEVIALVGESGAGKSTVTSLAMRFHDVTAGSITWDGVDLREIAPKSLRSQIALVTQDVIVFDDTVARNIAYGDAEPDMKRVEAAARAAHADEFIADLENGYETRLGQGGGRLSGGQRQRIAIARALYKDAPVLILDEATSSLDSSSEALVQDALSHLMAGRTVLVVAHRLATIRAADRIIVMSEGRIVQEGSHAELVEREGTYQKLHQLQTG